MPVPEPEEKLVIHVNPEKELSRLRLDGSDRHHDDPSKDRTVEARKHTTLAGLINMHAVSLRSLSGLDSLTELTHMFINETDDIPVLVFHDSTWTKSFEILDASGAQLLFALATIKKCLGTHRFFSHSFSLQVKDATGETVVSVDCSSGCFGRKRKVIVKHRQELYGFLKPDGDCCTPDYSVNSSKDKPFLRIRPPKPVNCFLRVPVDYCIYNAEFATEVGCLKTDWSTSGLDAIIDISNNGFIYGARFPRVMPVSHKVMILAAMFTFKIFPG